MWRSFVVCSRQKERKHETDEMGGTAFAKLEKKTH